MVSYGNWLAAQDGGKDPDVKILQEFVKNNSADWPISSSTPSDYSRIIKAKGGNDEAALLSSLLETISDWNSCDKEKHPAKDMRELVFRAATDALDNFGLIFLALAATVICGLISYGIFDSNFLTSISAPEQARGLITFLFSFSTVAIFLIIVICIFFFDTNGLKERIDHAKDILSLIIGIFGTILGFYFGSLINTAREAEKTLHLTNVRADPEIAKPGSKVTVSASALGGTKPYTYDFVASDATGKVGLSENRKDLSVDKTTGELKQTIDIPSVVSDPSSIVYTITLRDTNKALAQAGGVIVVDVRR